MNYMACNAVLNLLPLTGMETDQADCLIIELQNCFKPLTPHGDGNCFRQVIESVSSIIVLNLLPLTGMETLLDLQKYRENHEGFKPLTPHGDGNFQLHTLNQMS